MSRQQQCRNCIAALLFNRVEQSQTKKAQLQSKEIQKETTDFPPTEPTADRPWPSVCVTGVSCNKHALPASRTTKYKLEREKNTYVHKVNVKSPHFPKMVFKNGISKWIPDNVVYSNIQTCCQQPAGQQSRPTFLDSLYTLCTINSPEFPDGKNTSLKKSKELPVVQIKIKHAGNEQRRTKKKERKRKKRFLFKRMETCDGLGPI